MLRNEEEYKLELNKNTYRAIKTLTNTSIDIEKYIDDCIEDYQLFQKENEKFHSNSLLRRMAEKDRKSEIARERANKRWNSNAIAMQQQCDSNANKVKKKKENKSKANKKEQEEKTHFAEFVSMTNAEYEKLVSTYGKGFTDQCVKKLDDYKGSSGKDYKSDYRAICSWVIDEIKNKTSDNSKDTSRKLYQNYEQREYNNLDFLYANKKE